MSAGKSERAVELLVYAPIGLAATLADAAPALLQAFAARGRSEMTRRGEEVSRRVTTLRSMGEVAIAFGLPRLRARAGEAVREYSGRNGATADRSVSTPVAPAPEPPPTPVPVPAPEVDAVAHVPARPAPASAHLPIPGYDTLSASQVVERLAGLGRDELDAVRTYEDAHRRRRTILGKIDQLTA